MKKKILILTSTFPRWENDHEPPFVYELSRRYTEHYEVHVLAPHTAGSSPQEILGGMTVHRFRYAPATLEKLAYGGGIPANLRKNPFLYLLVPLFILAELFSVIRILRHENIALIHAHWIIPQGLVAVIAARFARRRPALLVTAHGADVYTRQGSLTSLLKRTILNHSDHLTVVSKDMLNAVSQPGLKCPVDILPMGVDLTETFIPEPGNRKPTQLVFVGRLVEKKGVRYLLDGFSKVISRHPQLNLVIIGDGPEKVSLHKYAETLGLLDRITFTGGLPQKELANYMQQSMIAVFPFLRAADGDQEGFGLVVAEAMGCGCATIATNLPAVRDIVENRVTGLLVEEKNSDAIANAVTELIENPALRGNVSEAGRNFVQNRFSWRLIANSYLGLINDMLKTAAD